MLTGQRKRPSRWNLLLVWPWVVGLGFSIYWWSADRQVARRQQTILATITAHQENHNNYCYIFLLNGKPYGGCDNSFKDGDEPHIGQEVLIYYDPINPSTNAFSDFENLADRHFGLVLALLLGIGTALLVIARLLRGKSILRSDAA